MKKKLTSSLTAKLFLLTSAVLIVCCFATYLFIVWAVPNTYENKPDLEGAELAASQLAQEFDLIPIEQYAIQAEALQAIANDNLEGDLDIHIFDGSGAEVSLHDISELTGKSISDYPTNKRTREHNIHFADRDETYSMAYVDSSKAVNQALDALQAVLPYLVIMVLAVSLLTAFVYSKIVTAPAKEISRVSRKMAALDFDAHAKTSRTDELGEVSNNLNALSQKLSSTLGELESANVKLAEDFQREKQMEHQRSELFASLSHELKTPITIAKGQLQGMIAGVGRYKDRDAYLVQSLDAMTRLEQMVQELLIISRTDSPDYTCHRVPLDLSELIHRCLIAQEDMFILKDISLSCDMADSIDFCGDRQLLERAFTNIIVNALTYSPSGNSLKVTMTQSETGIRCRFENTGVHIEVDDLEHLLEPFYRAEQSRNRETGGSGLGLYIVKQVMDLHGAHCHIENTERGVAATVEL